MKKILLVSGGLYPPNIYFSGVGAILNLYRKIALRENKLEIHFLTSVPSKFKDSCNQWALNEKKENKLHFHFIFFDGFKDFEVFNLILTRILLFLATINLQLKFRFKVVNDFSSSPLLLFSPLVLRFLGVKTIHTYCTLSRFNFFDSKLLWKFIGADEIIVTSAWAKNKLLDLGMNSSKINYISFGVETEKFLSRHKVGSPLRVVFVGSKERKRGVDLFFEAAKQIPEAEFIWVTKAGSKPGNNVKTIVGRVDIAKIFNESNIAVFPYLSLEGILFEPQTLLEAMASGLAIVVADFPSIRKILDEDGALFFQPGKQEEFIKKLKMLVKNPALIKKLGINTRKKAEENFDLGCNVKKLLGIYQNI